MPTNPLPRVRRICLALPEAHEVEAWGEPTFRIRNKIFASYASAHTHHGRGRPAIWCMAGPGNQEFMVQARPDRFFVPPYVGPSGWIGVYLDGRVPWSQVAALLHDAYELRVGRSKRPTATHAGQSGARSGGPSGSDRSPRRTASKR
jgi:predicted DNA-binding protein (MmcQ/YjbR family)